MDGIFAMVLTFTSSSVLLAWHARAIETKFYLAGCPAHTSTRDSIAAFESHRVDEMEPASTGVGPEAPIEAASRVFAITELAEAILEHLPPRDLLLSQRVCRQFRDIFQSSTAFKQKLHLMHPENDGVFKVMPVLPSFLENSINNTPFSHGRQFVTVEFNRTYEAHSTDASWRSMQLSSPPVITAFFFGYGPNGWECRTAEGTSDLRRIRCSEGLSLKHITDAASRTRERHPHVARHRFILYTG
ncbi:hypothetical protein AC578_2473 [Pseudocercospora eumusae]|uniref:F-box domain-containing protein n=1 Tax=Pseudocercospora eumusae TaxID=321146 RepID=A0A139HXL1_9PEZI|nr:hypothetical protein AC578_2473 [Pseudocercospora eumusae]